MYYYMANYSKLILNVLGTWDPGDFPLWSPPGAFPPKPAPKGTLKGLEHP